MVLKEWYLKNNSSRFFDYLFFNYLYSCKKKPFTPVSESIGEKIKLYESAALKHNPEAMIMLAIILHMTMYERLGGPNVGHFDVDLPSDTLNRICQIDRQEFNNRHYEAMFYTMWDYVEQSASMNWLTPFHMKIYERAIKTDFYSPSEHLRRLVGKRDSQFDEIRDKMQSKLTFRCFNISCTFRVAKESMLKSCKNCLTAKYCSKECQIEDWHKKHKKECVKNTEEGNINKLIRLNKFIKVFFSSLSLIV